MGDFTKAAEQFLENRVNVIEATSHAITGRAPMVRSSEYSSPERSWVPPSSHPLCLQSYVVLEFRVYDSGWYHPLKEVSEILRLLGT